MHHRPNTGILLLPLVLIGAWPNRLPAQPQIISEDKAWAQILLRVPKKLDGELSHRIGEIDRVCGLSQQQKEKLRLMGQGDIKRLTNQLRTTEGVEPALLERLVDMTIDAGYFHDGTLFRRSISHVLDAKQRELLGRVVSEDHRKRQERITNSILSVPGKLMPEEREQIIAILKTIPLPERADRNGTNFATLQLAVIANQHPDRLKSEFFKHMLSFYPKQISAIEAFFVRIGYLPAEDEKCSAPEASKKPPAKDAAKPN